MILRASSTLAAQHCGYTTRAAARPLRAKGPLLTLDHFLQKKRALALWRDVVRALNRIPPSATREELRKYARGEFERNRNVTDIHHIRYLISTGKTEFDAMKRYVDEQAA